MSEVLKITSLGIDFKRYSVFQFLTPEIYRNMSGNYDSLSLRRPSEKGLKVDRENCQFCINFVLDCSIKLQEFNVSQYLQ